MQLLNSTTPRIDLGLLDEIEQRLQELIESSTKLDIPEPEPSSALTPIVGESMDANLIGWQNQLAELSRQSSELEQELTAQEQSLRKWFEALAARKKLLQSLAG